jgi:hypothetical protein
MRKSKQQLKDEIEEMYLEMTDPEKIDERLRRKRREDYIKEKKEEYGI